VRTDSGTTVNLASGDAYGHVFCDAATAIAFKINVDASLTYPVGGFTYVWVIGAGQATVSANTPGTTDIRGIGDTGTQGTGALRSVARGAPILLFKKAANTWRVAGATTP
jgi:hypothetical protein